MNNENLNLPPNVLGKMYTLSDDAWHYLIEAKRVIIGKNWLISQFIFLEQEN